MKNNLPTSAFVAVTYDCNSRCVMCDIWKRNSKLKTQNSKLATEIFKKLPSSLESVDITGGEPFLREDLRQIVEIIHQRCPRARLLITTNGLLPERIGKISADLINIDPKLAFRVSLDGIGKTHDKIRGIKGAYKKVLATLGALREMDIKDLGIIFTLINDNSQELKQILRFCKTENLQFSLNLVHDSPIYFGGKKTGLRPNIEDTSAALSLVTQFFTPSFKPRNWAKVWFYNGLIDYAKTGKRPIRCGAGEKFFYLDPMGNIYMCHFQNWLIGNLMDQSFSKIWHGNLRKKYLKLANLCNGCFMICTAKNEIEKKKWEVVKQCFS